MYICHNSESLFVMGATRWLFKIILFKCIFLLVQPVTVHASCQEEFTNLEDAQHVQNFTAPNKKINILLPFYNIELDKVDNIKIAKNSIGVFVLNGKSVYRLNITHEKRELKFVRELLDVGGDVTGFEVIPWGNHVICIISLIDHFNVYLIELSSQKYGPDSPIQKVAIYGKFRKFVHFSSWKGVYLSMATNFTELHGRLSFYKWEHSYFHLIEEKSIQPVSDMVGVSDNTKQFLFTIKYGKPRSKTSIQTYVIADDNLRRTQNFYLDSNLILPFTFRQNFYIIACSSRLGVCTTYSVTDVELIEFNKGTYNETFNKLSSGKDYIIAERPGGEFIITADIKLRCFGVFKSNDSDLTEILTHSNNDGHHFILLIYMRSPKVTMQVVEITFETIGGDSEILSSSHSTLDMSLSRLRNFLLSSKSEVNDLKQMMHLDGTRPSKKLITNLPVHINTGKIEKVSVIGKSLMGLSKLSAKLHKMKAELKKLANKKDRFKRNADIFKVKNLRVKNLEYNGTIFEGTKLKDGILTISTPTITTNSIGVTKLEINSTSAKPRTFDESIRRQLISNELFVKKINGIEWEYFYNDLFLKNQNSSIQGTLTFQESAHIINLEIQELNGRAVNNFFTLTTEQDIYSSILISQISAPSVYTNELNGLNIEKDIAKAGAHNFIQSPVLARWIKVEKNLTLGEKAHMNFARYIFGSESKDFLQIYSKRVFINGSLTLKNVDLKNPGLRTIVAGNEFGFDFNKKYWLKSLDQEFDEITFLESISVQRLDVNYLNDEDISNFLLTNRNQTGHVSLIFNSSTVLGNINVNPQKVPSSKLSQLSKNVIRKFERADILDIKEFCEGFAVDILETYSLNEIPVKNLISIGSHTLRFDAKKDFTALTVEDEFIVNDLYITKVNGEDLHEFFTTAKSVDKEINIEHITLHDTSTLRNIFFNTINNYQITKLMDVLEITGDSILLHKDISVHGNVVFEKNLNCTWINGINWNEYFNLLVFLDMPAQIGGAKVFVDSVIIKDRANIKLINNLYFEELTGNFLSKTRPQTIKALWNFGHADFKKSLSAPIINEIETSLLIDSRERSISISSDLLIKDFEVAGNMNGMINIDFAYMEEKMKSFNQEHWKEIRVLQDAEWQIDDTELDFLLQNAVRVDSHQVIYGNVTFAENTYFNLVDGRFYPNRMDIFAIYNDSLVKRKSSTQVIVAKKNFMKPLKLSQLITQNYLAAQIVNNVDILGFNASIFRVTEDILVTGRKTFVKPPLIEYLTVYGTINHIDLRNVITNAYNGILPPIRISDLIIGQTVQIKTVNEFDFDYFLSIRARKHGPAQEFSGYLTFESLTLKHNVSLTFINEINLNNILLKDSQVLQEIHGTKRISGNLYLMGPAHFVNLNDVDVTLKFEKSIQLDECYNLQKISAKNIAFHEGVIVSDMLNSYKVEDYFSWFKHFCQEISHDIYNLDTRLSTVQNTVDRLFLGQRLLYLEYDTTRTILWNRTTENAIDEHILSSTCSDIGSDYLCKTQKLLVQVLPDRIYLNNLKNSNVLKSRLQNVNVLVENKQNAKTTEMSILWESDRTQKYYQKNITFNYLIEKIESFEVSTNPSKFLLIQFEHDNPVIIIKIDAIKNQPLPIQAINHQKIGKNLDLQLYSFHDKTFLITSTESAIYIYEFNIKEEIFRIVQNITELYDIFDLVQVKGNLYHLLLSCKSCEHIAVYEFDVKATSISSPFYLFQILRIKTHVKKISHFVNSFGKFMVVTTKRGDGYYYLYKYNYIEGWTDITFGYFDNIEYAIPIQGMSTNAEDYVLVTSGNSSAAVLLYSQG